MGIYRTSGIFPEIGGVGIITLSIIGLLGGVLLGTHHEWWIQLIAIAAVVWIVEIFGPGELSQLAYIVPVAVFIFGVVIGDINWALQTGVTVSMPEITNPFLVK